MNDKKSAGSGGRGMSASMAMGAVALIFLAAGYQTALFIHRAAALRIVSSHPDTVFVRDGPVPVTESLPGEVLEKSRTVKAEPGRSVAAAGNTGSSGKELVKAKVRENYSPRVYECFRFDPNTATVAELQRLGFSAAQAKSIDNYRDKGGHYWRKSDFAKSFVVADSVYARLESWIEIPKLDINQADSADFDALPGIGKYFAAKMVEHREELGGYSDIEQLLDIYRFTEETFDKISDLIYTGPKQ